MTIKAGGKTFKTKTTLENYCKFVLNNAEIGSYLEGEWELVVTDVLKMHEDFLIKTNGGEGFKVGVRKCFINPRNRQFFILRSDGTDTDFSYRKALSPKSKASYVKETLRALIKEQTNAFKDKYFEENQDSKGYVVCPETGLKIKKKDSHIDHYPKQFDEIVKDWAESRNLKSKDIILVQPPENSTFWPLEDKSLEKDFKEYHQKEATYRIVLNKVNLQRGRSKRFDF